MWFITDAAPTVTTMIESLFPKYLLQLLLNLMIIIIFYELNHLGYFVDARRKIKYLPNDPSNENDHIYSDWLVNDNCVIIQLFNIMEEKVSSSVMFLKTIKEIWDIL